MVYYCKQPLFKYGLKIHTRRLPTHPPSGAKKWETRTGAINSPPRGLHCDFFHIKPTPPIQSLRERKYNGKIADSSHFQVVEFLFSITESHHVRSLYYLSSYQANQNDLFWCTYLNIQVVIITAFVIIILCTFNLFSYLDRQPTGKSYARIKLIKIISHVLHAGSAGLENVLQMFLEMLCPLT